MNLDRILRPLLIAVVCVYVEVVRVCPHTHTRLCGCDHRRKFNKSEVRIFGRALSCRLPPGLIEWVQFGAIAWPLFLPLQMSSFLRTKLGRYLSIHGQKGWMEGKETIFCYISTSFRLSRGKRKRRSEPSFNLCAYLFFCHPSSKSRYVVS